jgi:hypothetical protein
MELAHRTVMISAEEVEVVQKEMNMNANHLAAVTSLLNLLIRLRFGLTSEEALVLEGCLSPLPDPDKCSAADPLAVGWEEITDAALTHLLRTSLSSKSSSSASSSSISSSGLLLDATSLTLPQDTSKLQRHLTILCDRLQKGNNNNNNNSNKNKNKNNTNNNAKNLILFPIVCWLLLLIDKFASPLSTISGGSLVARRKSSTLSAEAKSEGKN